MAAVTPPTDAREQRKAGGVGRLIARNASALTVGRLVNAAIGIVSVGVTSRYLGVDVYGTLVTVTAFTVLLGGVMDMGVLMIGARELASRPGETRRLMGSLFTVGIAQSLLVASVGLAIGYHIYAGDGESMERQGLAILLLLPLPFAAAAGPAGAYLVATQRVYITALGSTIASVMMAMILVLAVTLDLGFAVVVIATAIQPIVGALAIIIYTLPKTRYRPLWEPRLCKQLLKWALPLGGVYILGSVYWRIDIVLLSVIGTQADVGVYGLAYKVVDTIYILPLLVMVTLLPEFARFAHMPDRRDELVEKAATVMQLAVVPLLVFTIAFARQITAVAGGAAFQGAAIVLQILMLGVAAGFIRAVFTQALIALNRQVWLMYATAVVLVANVGLNMGLVPILGARGAAIAYVATEVVALGLALFLFRRIGTVPRPRRLPQMLSAGCVMAVTTLLQHLPTAESASPAILVSVLGPLSIAVYTACLYAFRAMPDEVHRTIIVPLLVKLRSARSAA